MLKWKSPANELAGVDTRVCTCVLRACFPNTAVSLSPPSAAFPLSTGTRGTHPPPTPQRWIEGFPSFCLSYNLSISVSPDNPVVPKCAIEDVDVCQQGAIDCPMVLALASKATQLPRSPRLPRSLEKWAEHVTQNWENAEILLVLGKN